MQSEELLALLARARTVFHRYMTDEGGEIIRDDIAEICMAIDDALPDAARVEVKKVELEPASHRSAA